MSLIHFVIKGLRAEAAALDVLATDGAKLYEPGELRILAALSAAKANAADALELEERARTEPMETSRG